MKRGTNEIPTWNFPKRVFVIFFVIIGLLFLQYCYVALFPVVYGVNMGEFANNRNTVSSTLYAKRGTIFDNNNNILAVNVSSYTVIAYLDPSRTGNSEYPLHVVDKKGTAEKLASVLGMTADYIEKLLETDAYQVELGPGGRGITELKKGEIEDLNLPGIDFIENYKRYYPNGDFASYIVGYAKQNEVVEEKDGATSTKYSIDGELGIEVKYDELLKGKDGFLSFQKDRFGYKIPDTPEQRTDAENGSDIYLTIDSNIQRFVESAVKEATEKYKPEWMMLHVMDAKTGDILGTAGTPSFDPNIRDIVNYENPLTSYVYEPGSTMKIYTYMCALEKGSYKPDELFMSGSIKIGDDTIYDWNKNGWGKISYDKGFEYSSNVGATNIVQNFIDKNELRDCLTKYGFGAETGIQLPREFTGAIDFNYPMEVAAAAYGQGISTTAIQHLQALSILANDGKMVKPHIIQQIVNPNTKSSTYTRTVEVSDPLISIDTVRKMKELMYNVVNGADPAATGHPYQIAGFDIIGKTGTAQIFDSSKGSYLTGSNDYIFSFSGLYPKDNPEIIIYAAVKKPTEGGSKAISEGVKSVLESIAKYKNMFGGNNTESNIAEVTLPSFNRWLVTDAKELLEKNHIIPVILGNGDRIIGQYPNASARVLSYDKVFLLTNGETVAIPSLIGWSRSDVESLGYILGLSVTIDGYGYVTEQNLKEGTLLSDGMTIQVKLANKPGIDPIPNGTDDKKEDGKKNPSSP